MVSRSLDCFHSPPLNSADGTRASISRTAEGRCSLAVTDTSSPFSLRPAYAGDSIFGNQLDSDLGHSRVKQRLNSVLRLGPSDRVRPTLQRQGTRYEGVQLDRSGR